MSEDAHKTTEGAVLIKRIGRNVLNVGIFLVEVLFLILAGPALLKFFMPVVLVLLIACIANPLVKFLEKRLHIVRKHSSFVVILGAILLIVLGCYYGITALFYEGAKIVERFPTYYATLLDSLNHLGDQLQQLVGRMSPEMSDKIEQLTDLITSNLGQIAGSLGSITVGALEMSNVDLASEFTNMITTQRGFQANSRIITTSDTMLEELVNLKR